MATPAKENVCTNVDLSIAFCFKLGTHTRQTDERTAEWDP